MPAMPVPAITTTSHAMLRALGPCSKRSNVSGPGARKKTQIQIGQCATPVHLLVSFADAPLAGIFVTHCSGCRTAEDVAAAFAAQRQ